MIDFELPPFIKNQTQLIEMVAKQAMRPYSRDLDEHEHDRPHCIRTNDLAIYAGNGEAGLERLAT